jgi:hypothetical protein
LVGNGDSYLVSVGCVDGIYPHIAGRDQGNRVSGAKQGRKKFLVADRRQPRSKQQRLRCRVRDQSALARSPSPPCTTALHCRHDLVAQCRGLRQRHRGTHSLTRHFFLVHLPVISIHFIQSEPTLVQSQLRGVGFGCDPTLTPILR